MEEVSLQDEAIMFVACTMSRALRRELASLLFSTQARYLSASFFLYLLFAQRIIPWSSGCIIKVAVVMCEGYEVNSLSCIGVLPFIEGSLGDGTSGLVAVSRDSEEHA